MAGADGEPSLVSCRLFLSFFNMSSGSGEQEGVQNSAGFVGLQAAGFMEAVVGDELLAGVMEVEIRDELLRF